MHLIGDRRDKKINIALFDQRQATGIFMLIGQMEYSFMPLHLTYRRSSMLLHMAADV